MYFLFYFFKKTKLFLQVLNTSLNFLNLVKDQNLYSEALKLYPSSTQEYKVCKLETVQCQSFLFPYACVWISSAPCTGAGMKLQLLVFKFCRSLLFQCCVRPSSEIRAGMTLSTSPAGLVINGCYSFSPVTQRAPGSPVSSAALFCSVLNNFHNLRKTSSCLDL